MHYISFIFLSATFLLFFSTPYPEQLHIYLQV